MWMHFLSTHIFIQKIYNNRKTYGFTQVTALGGGEMRKKPKNKQFLYTALAIIIAGLLILTYIVIISQEPEDEEKIEEDIETARVIDDTISPIGMKQAVAIEIQRIHKKGIEQVMRKIGNSWKNKPSYHYEAIVDGETWVGKNIDSWDTGYVGWEALKEVEDEQGEASIEIKIVETQKKLLRSVDEEIESFKINYDFRTGHWDGDDFFNDSDGYRHYNGEHYEIWFDIHQLDYDGDGIPYWTEINVLDTDPNFDDSKMDPDMDNVSTSWEWKWNYDPFTWEDHSFLDPDNDGLENTEEYFMEKWLANPFSKDIYVEVDFMKKGPGLFGYEHILPKESQWIVMDAYSEHMITLHVDDGWPGGPVNGGGEFLRYVEDTIDPADGIGSEFYKYHFAEERRGIFRYLFIQHGRIGWVNPQDYRWHPDVITCPYNLKWFAKSMLAITPRLRTMSQAVCFIHEMGHSLGLTPRTHGGIDNKTQVGRNDLPPLEKLTCPALFLFGENDGQIRIKENGSIIIAALYKAENYNYTISVIPDVGHYFVKDWSKVKKEFGPGFLNRITNWALENVNIR